MQKHANIPEVIELTGQLIRWNTTEPANNERGVLEELAILFESNGFTCTLSQYDPENPAKCSLIAESNPGWKKPALCLGGHIDTVPFGDVPWSGNPLSGEVVDGYVYGRGSVDMKGGMAAMICAAIRMAPKVGDGNIVVHVYGGEELGLLGSRHLAVNEQQTLNHIGAVLIGEPTGLTVQAGHKGTFWLKFSTKGITAHSAMPHMGDNALSKLLPTANRLKDYVPQYAHPHLGKSTAVLATLHSGLNTNSVPDSAYATVDVRTVPGQTPDLIMAEARKLCDPEVHVEHIADVPPLWTEPDHPWCLRVHAITQKVTKDGTSVGTAQFATDGAALRLYMKDTPILLIGPGPQNMAHMVDERIAVQELLDAQTIYEAVIRDWYGF